MSKLRMLKKQRFIAASLVFFIVLCVWGKSAWSQDSQLQNSLPEGSISVAQLQTVIPRSTVTYKHAMLIVIETNQTQRYSVSWTGLSNSVQNVDPLSLMPGNVSIPIQNVINKNLPNTANFKTDMTKEMRRLLNNMLADILGGGFVSGFSVPGVGDLLAGVASQSRTTGKDIFATFRDYVGETGLATVLTQIATPNYDKVVVLQDQQATFTNLKTQLMALHDQGYIIDIFLDLHGCGTPVAHNAKACGDTRMTFADRSVSETEIRNINGGLTIKGLNTVYMTTCWGASFNNAWLNLGAKASNGSAEINFYGFLSPMIFMSQYAAGGLTLMEAATNAYNAEKTLYHGPTYTAALNLQPLLDKWFPLLHPGLIPCPPGYSMKTDNNGTTDQCVMGFTRLNAQCPPGFSRQVVSGTDKCNPSADPIATACGGSRAQCSWNFDLGSQWSSRADYSMGKEYGADPSKPIDISATSMRTHGGNMSVTRRWGL